MTKIISILSTSWKILWRILLFFICWGLLISLIVVPLGPKISGWQKLNPDGFLFYSNIIMFLTVLAATWLLVHFIDHRPLRSIGLSLNHFLRDMLTGLAVGIVWLALSLGIALIFGWLSPVPPIGFSWSVLLISSAAMLFNVITQEFLLCGFIFQSIRSQSNALIALIISSLLFASYHAGAFKGEWLPIVNVFLAGSLFCLAYIMTNNLWFPIFIHFAWDNLLGPVFGLTESGKNDLGGSWNMFNLKGPHLFAGGAFGLEGGLIVTFTVSFVIFFLLLRVIRKKPGV